jgi:hypothetical protein
MRFELTTFTLANCEHRSEVSHNQELSEASTEACTNACTDSPESTHGDTGGDDFRRAVADVMRLPLTDAEKAEAMRRLLTGKAVT